MDGLPHREPFVFVERLVERVPGESAVCEKTFAADDPMFRGHFPGNPIVPGVILTEALAQTAGLAAADATPGGFLLSAIRAMKFPAPARPGQLLTLRARRSGTLGPLLQFDVEAVADGVTVAAGQVILNRTDPET
ncbi:MAG: 3-hydroxyacyl-ACP dehydratase FabZ family protein [Terrimicrobiaceae bacterium]|nr:3-hydroxyacyl-ACP dehydratase FabZ family protein [Terrimicrobiaceae bacterium]